MILSKPRRWAAVARTTEASERWARRPVMRSTTNSAGDAGKSRYDGSWGSIGGVAGAGVLGGDDCGRMMLLPLYCCARAHGRTVSGRHGPNIDITEYRAEGGEEEAQGLRHATPKPRTRTKTQVQASTTYKSGYQIIHQDQSNPSTHRVFTGTCRPPSAQSSNSR